MTTHEPPPMLCSECQKRPVTKTFVCSGKPFMVCDPCFARLELQDELDHWYVNIAKLESEDRYGEAIALLEQYFQANQHRDQEGWFARAVALHKAGILVQAARHVDPGRYADAEKACEDCERLGFDSLWHRWFHASLRAEALTELGRPREALALLEDTLKHRERPYLADARPLLAQLAELSAQLGEPVKEQWRPLAKAVARRFRVELPEAETLGLSILALRDITRELVPKRPDEWKNDPEEEPTSPTNTPAASSPQSTR